MRSPPLALVIAALVAHSTAVAQGAPAPSGAQRGAGDTLVLARVTIVDVREGRLVPDRTVVVIGNRIVSVAPHDARAAATGGRTIDARGAFLLPGLWDMHVHSAAAAEHELPVHLALGITGVRNMHATADTALALVQAIRRRVADGSIVGPRFVANGAIVDGPVPAQRGSVRVGTADDARRAVDSLAAGGADFIKVYLRLPRDAYLAAAARARERGIPLVGHVPVAVTVEEAADAGQRSVEHSDALDWSCSTKGDSIRGAFLGDPQQTREKYMRARAALTATWSAERCAPAIAALKRNATWVTPTLVVAWGPTNPDSALAPAASLAVMPAATIERWRGEMQQMPPEARRHEEAQARTGFELVGLLKRAGVEMLAGTDVGNPFVVPGWSLHRELELLVRAGLTPAEALRTATINPARFLGATDSLGTVEAGKLADLVLLDANPLEDIRSTARIRAVVANGRYLDRAALDAMLDRSRRSANP